MIILTALEWSLPLTNPVLKFLLILLIILLAPLMLNRLRIPHILGLIIAGAVVGPNGLHLMERDSGIILSGTAGLLYIMFLAGLEIDMAEFRQRSNRIVLFGLYTVGVPMLLAVPVLHAVLDYSWMKSVLVASMLASHTLIAYPILAKMGVTKNRAVSVTVGGTVIADTLSLLVLAGVVALATGKSGTAFWLRLAGGLVVFGAIVLELLPRLTRWFFKRNSDSTAQFVFVLVMVFTAAVLAEAAHLEGIIGAFLVGLSLNRLIPHVSSLRNRIEFVGNAIFIPFFLIGVGMLIDYRAFFGDWHTVWVATLLSSLAVVSKYIAAWIAQKHFGFSADERSLIFGLSNARAAAALAAVLVGYNLVLRILPDGTVLRLLDEPVLNGTIFMILVTCTIATFAAQRGAKRLSISAPEPLFDAIDADQERILIPVSNPDTLAELIQLGLVIKSKSNHEGLYALKIIDNTRRVEGDTSEGNKILERAAQLATAADVRLKKVLRHDFSVFNAISSAVHEHNITDLVMGLHVKANLSESFLGNIVEGVLDKCNVSTFIYKARQPVATIRRHVVVMPAKAEEEIGFSHWLARVWYLSKQTGAPLWFLGHPDTLAVVERIRSIDQVQASTRAMPSWANLTSLRNDLRPDDNLIVVMSRLHKPSYVPEMAQIANWMNSVFDQTSFLLLYPMQLGVHDDRMLDFSNPSLVEPIERLDEMGKNLARRFRRL